MSRRRNASAIGLTATAVLAIAAACNSGAVGSHSSSSTASGATASSPAPTQPSSGAQPPRDKTLHDNPLANDLRLNKSAAEQAIAVIPVKKPESMAGYSREKFPHWRDATSNGWTLKLPHGDCDVRDATLYRDGTDVKTNDNCTVLSGHWTEPYVGETTTNPHDLQIDHVVPLANAWRSGAAKWNIKQRTAYANAPEVTVISQSAANERKGDKGPEAWKPRLQSSYCLYALRWVQIKSDFGLNFTSTAEKNALKSMLATCDQRKA